MDSIINSALEEICAQGQNGIALPTLWTRLQPLLSSSNLDLSPGVKKAIWAGLLSVPSLQFQAPDASYSPSDLSIQSLEDAQNLNLKIVAKEHLRDNFVGLYNVQSANANMSSPQRRALERLAIARTNGITQSQLGKEFGIEGKNLFYVVRNLECQGLIVRQSAVVRTKDACNEGEQKNCPSVTTNLMYLYRYAKTLGSQEKIEITKEERAIESLGNVDESATNRDGSSGKCVKEDVYVKDYLPAMKAVCDKLEESNDKVLVVSDVKKDLGYCGSPSGHKDWRKICVRLKDAHIVEQFDAKVNGKVESCLRLLKKFSLKNFEPKTLGHGDDDFEEEQQLNFGKKHQITDQLVELPIEHQIYDMIDAAGSEGLTVMELCKRLGIDNKKNYNRLVNMFSRFGMELQAENHKKCVVYRVWTSRNFSSGPANAFLNKSKNVFDENKVSNLHVGNLDASKRSAHTFSEYDPSTSDCVACPEGDVAHPGKMINIEVDTELSQRSPRDVDVDQMHVCLDNLLDEPRTVSNAELKMVSTGMETSVTSLETPPPSVVKPLNSGSYQRYPCLTLTVDGARREQRILERLQDEKFILRGDLYKWLVSLEKDKCTTTDRKTIDRILNKLQQQGHCKCIHINAPVVTNFGRSRITQVVLHPSIQNLSPELLGEIHDRYRSFEMQSRGQGSSRGKHEGPVPVLKGVQRAQNHVGSDAQAIRSEAMRANGFILAKMVRAKLLHCFLWDYLNGSDGSTDALSYEKHVYELISPQSSSKLFSLEASIKAIPVELFLQVVGSTLKFDDMIEKCKRGLLLSDLPNQEYKNLMDTHATGRLSLIIDILRRLKLIRMITNGHLKGVGIPQANFTHVMELKPYIEEPLSKYAMSLSFRALDLRPRMRHDFILSSRAAVDEYWQTLEYCYAAADLRSALLAFPGSAVPEVFLFRSWASFRVMTAEQRAELIKRVVQDDLSEKISYKECEKIAKDLNLTLEQVLRVYYDKRQQRLNRFQGRGNEFQPIRRKRSSSSRRRDRSPEARSRKQNRVDTENGQLDQQRLNTLPDADKQFVEEKNLLDTHSEEHDFHLQTIKEDDHLETEDPGPNENECYSFISRCAFSENNPTRQRRFSWTDEDDRQLVIQYVRHRAAHGAKYHRTDWASLPDLPAPPSTCKKRMASLNRNKNFRKAIMRLCNMLGERYAKHLEKTQNSSLNKDDRRLLLRSSPMEGLNQIFANGDEHAGEAGCEEKSWDDINDKNIKIALDEVIRYKRMAKLEASKRVGSTYEEWSDLNKIAETYYSQESELDVSNTRQDVQNHGGMLQKAVVRKSRHRLQQKFINLLNEGANVSRRVYESLAVSNAVELFKLVFLSTSTAPAVPNLLAEILRRYSQHDLFAAFNYLRENKIMVGGNGTQPFELSLQFLHGVSKSKFPVNTGKRAAKFTIWLREKEKDLMEGGINLGEDLQCGEIFHLFALVSSGELSISPHLPDEGVGEAEDLRNLKRKSENNESCVGDKAKKPKTSVASEGEIVSRREKGFPGIMVSLRRATISIANALELFRDENSCTCEQLFLDGIHQSNITFGQSSSPHADHMKEVFDSNAFIPVSGSCNESPWEAMAGFAEHLMPLPFDQEQASPIYPEVFRTVYAAIKKAGDQGLSIEEVSQFINMPGKKMPELIIDVLQAFHQALKVNAYDSVRVVDSLYRSKYFLTSISDFCQDLKSPSSMKSSGRTGDDHSILLPENSVFGDANSQREVSLSANSLHKVTILNLPEEDANPSNESQTNNMQGKAVFPGGDNEGGTFAICSDEVCMPILPWINGDGTINKIVYKGLQRRILGIVMQNPGILEGDIIREMDILNPQSSRKLLDLMILDKHLYVKKMHQTTSNAPPAILGTLLGRNAGITNLYFREHFFANPMSTSLL
ncbi:hypothetical protein I3842_01G220300 [Carya illinoinensis]|uniref:B-block binding subunit of TFIIIC domain-containing protein n=1 Tax=Carya illinoinensis TaxID=32201 RepID=A0A922K5U2_CARIL|nr:hypothetical protein I3842_01G220300 [Carya illinoinensis]